MNQPLRILLMGDYSNCHRTLATGLRSLGHDVTVVSDGSKWQNTARDIDIARHGKSRAAGLELMLRLRYGIMPRLRNFDIVAIHNPGFLNLRPIRTKYFFDRLKGENRSIFLTAMGTDSAYLDLCSAADSPLRYTEWFIGGHPSPLYLSNPAKWRDWHNDEIRSFHEYVYDNIDGAVSILYEYHLAITRALGPDKCAFGGLPIDLSGIQPVDLDPDPEVVKLYLGRHRERCIEKGTDVLEAAARDVIARHEGRVTLSIIENLPYDRYIKTICGHHISLDQLYSYSPATNALLAMAYGLNAVSGAEPEFYNFIGEPAGDPVINAPVDYDRLVETLDAVVSDPQAIAPRGRRSRQFVERHHDCRHVAQRFLDFWTSKL